MENTAFLSLRVPGTVRSRIKTVAAARGETIQAMISNLIEEFLAEAERKPPALAEVMQALRDLEPEIKAHGVVALWVFGSVARGDARPDSDVDLLVDFDPQAKVSLYGQVHLKDFIEEKLGRPVDLGEREMLRPHVKATTTSDLVRVF